MQNNIINYLIQQKMQEQLDDPNSNYNLNTGRVPQQKMPQGYAPDDSGYVVKNMDYETARQKLAGGAQSRQPAAQQQAQQQTQPQEQNQTQYVVPNMDYATAKAKLAQFAKERQSGRPDERPSYENIPTAPTTPYPEQPKQPSWNDTVNEKIRNDESLVDLPKNLGKHGLADVATAGQNIGNIPSKLSSGRIPEVNYDYYKMLGIEPTIGDRAAVGVMEYSPYSGGANLLTKIPAFAKVAKTGSIAEEILKNTASGVSYAGVNAPEGQKTQAMKTAAVFAPAATLAGVGVNAGAKYTTKQYAQSAVPGLTEKANEATKYVGSPDKYSKELGAKFEKDFKTNENTWETSREIAKGLDKQIPKVIKEEQIPTGLVDGKGNPLMKTKAIEESGFNNKPYTDYLDTYIKEKSSLEPAMRQKYSEALEIAQDAKSLAPKSFEGAISTRQNLNSDLSDILKSRGKEAPNEESKALIKNLKNIALQDTIKANKSSVDPKTFSNFENTWNKANSEYQKLQNFYKLPTDIGSVKDASKLREAYKTGQIGEDVILNKYVPTTSKKGMTGLKQLEKVYGNKEKTQEAAKSYILKDIKENGSSTKDISEAYAKLSPEQRKYIFGNSKEYQYLEMINNIRKTFGKEAKESSVRAFGHHLVGLGLPGFAGYMAGEYADKSGKESLTYGALAALAAASAKKGASKFSTLNMLDKASKYYQAPAQNRGKYINMILQENLNPSLKEEKKNG